MKISLVHRDSIEIGTVVEMNGARAFFGNRHASSSDIENKFPGIKTFFQKQIHSALVIPAEESREADAHWTKQIGTAPSLYTADCVPLLFYAPDIRCVAAAHAGWRGLAGYIIRHTVEVLTIQGADQTGIKVLIGPHIRVGSFEVHRDVAEKIAITVPNKDSILRPHKDTEKIYVDLTRASRLHLLREGLRNDNIIELPGDTFSDQNYASYRRDSKTGNRQVSFIFLS